MKTIVLTLLFSCGVACAQKPVPADYTLVMHVVGSQKGSERTVKVPWPRQILEVVLDGEHLELTQADDFGRLIGLGDYPAKLMPQNMKHVATYEVERRYRLWFADGTIHDFDVTGLGTLAEAGAHTGGR